jgi:hypothetical protein
MLRRQQLLIRRTEELEEVLSYARRLREQQQQIEEHNDLDQQYEDFADFTLALDLHFPGRCPARQGGKLEFLRLNV